MKYLFTLIALYITCLPSQGQAKCGLTAGINSASIYHDFSQYKNPYGSRIGFSGGFICNIPFSQKNEPAAIFYLFIERI
jgi:hypothetical protein